jgi:hypothetical protein
MKKNASFKSKLKSLDFFGLGVNFKIDGNETSKSYFGAAMTSICSLLVVAYALYQL